ncbi:MAG TPA: DUF2127 domain-containing protein [Tahibacter sp.]|nr:DUF2127 domain-containing protein [Tahibacter sp.]
MRPPPDTGSTALAWIAIFKFVKSAVLIAFAFVVHGLTHAQAQQHFVYWLGHNAMSPHTQLLQHAAQWLDGTPPSRIDLAVGAALVYATLYAVEGWGLWRRKSWAIWMTLVATSLFVPLEIWALATHPTWLRAGALVINLAIVGYLAIMLRRRR